MASADALRCGRIAYTNVLPIYAAFDAGAVDFPGTLHRDVPATLNAMLLEGRLDISPVSAVCWAQHADELALLPELCIGARDAVWSVVCVSPKPLAALDGATIAVTRESASGRNLLRVLLERRYRVRATFVESDDPLGVARRGEPALLIGDPALAARAALPAATVIDLGAEWHAWTGLDIVFAVWAARREEFDVAAHETFVRTNEMLAPFEDPLMAAYDMLVPTADVFAAPPGAAEPAAPVTPDAQVSPARRDIEAAFSALLAGRRWGSENRDAVVAAAQRVHERAPGFYAAYFDALNFSFDERARAGLTRYLEELHAIGAIEYVPSVVPEALLAAN